MQVNNDFLHFIVICFEESSEVGLRKSTGSRWNQCCLFVFVMSFVLLKVPGDFSTGFLPDLFASVHSYLMDQD